MSSASDEVLTCEKAGFGIRVGATLIDWTILRVGYAVLVAVIGAVFPSRPAPAGAEFLSSLVLPLMLWTLSIGYFLFFWTYSGQTLGHRILRLKVIRTDGRPLRLGASVVRCIGELLSFAALGLGLIWVAFDANQQGWHDKIAGTYVIHVNRRAPNLESVPRRRRYRRIDVPIAASDAHVAPLGDSLGGPLPEEEQR